MDLYLFGAGASAAEGAPATANLLQAAWRELGPGFEPPVRRVWAFLEQVFGVAVTGPECFGSLPPVDWLFGLIDWSLQADQGLGPTYDPADLGRVRRDLEYLLCMTLQAAVRRRGPGGPHDRFARAVLKHRDFAVLSLNYDTLLDEALARAGAVPDYGLRRMDLGRQPPSPLLLKLHGSLNWALCKACDHVEVADRPAAHLLPQSDALTCRRCGNRHLAGLVVSPTWAKGAMPVQVRHVWDLALEAIRQADRLLFVGYSLPDADVGIYHLIRRGMLTRAGRRPLRIGVINHRAESCAPELRCHEEEAVRAHFRRLFGQEVAFDFTGFRGQTADFVIL